MNPPPTGWQTVGPFFTIGMARLYRTEIAGEDAPGQRIPGQRIQVRGRVLDGKGQPISDALLEIWQADAHGKYPQPEDAQNQPVENQPLESGFRGYGRIPTDHQGSFRFATIKPGPVPGPDGEFQAPHLVVGLMMRGLLKGLVTRIYFPGEPLNDRDQILRLIEPGRRRTLLLTPVAGEADVFDWEIHMQGEDETVFLEF